MQAPEFTFDLAPNVDVHEDRGAPLFSRRKAVKPRLLSDSGFPRCSVRALDPFVRTGDGRIKRDPVTGSAESRHRAQGVKHAQEEQRGTA